MTTYDELVLFCVMGNFGDGNGTRDILDIGSATYYLISTRIASESIRGL